MYNSNKLLINLLFIGCVLFYGLPIIAESIPADSGMSFFILVLMLINPIYSLVSSILVVRRSGFKWYLPVLIGMLFLPTVFVFYNSSAIVYAFAYAVISLIGSVIGIAFYRRPI